MASEYSLKTDGFKSRDIKIIVDEEIHDIAVYESELRAEKGESTGCYVVNNDNGNPVEIECGLSSDDLTPWAKIDGVPVELAKKIYWYQWAWIGLPIILVFFGGIIGGMLGGAATYLNLKIMRSNMGPAGKYLISGAITGATIFLYLVIAVSMQFMLKPEMRKSFFDGIKTMGDSSSTPSAYEKYADIPNFYIDNGSPKSLEFTVDGKNKTPLPPFSFVNMKLKIGTHNVKVTDNGSPYDDAEIRIDKNRVLLLNTKSLCDYMLLNASYVVGSPMIEGGGIGQNKKEKQKFIESDFGLLENLPENVEIKVKTSEFTKIFERSKLVKILPVELSSEQAEEILKEKPEKLSVVYFNYGQDQFKIPVFKALGKEPKKSERMNILLENAATEDNGYVLESILKSLSLYESDIPDEKLLEMVKNPDKSSTGGLNVSSPAANGRSGWAIKLLLSRCRQELLCSNFQNLTDSTKSGILCLAWDAPDKTWLEIAKTALKSPINESDYSYLLRLITRKEFVPDEETVELVGKFIEKIEDPSKKKNWETFWNAKILELASGDSSAEKFVEKAVSSLVKSDQQTQYQAINALLNKKQFKPILLSFEEIDSYNQKHVISSLPNKNTVKEIPSEVSDIAWLGLKGQKDSVWQAALGWICYNSTDFPDTLFKLWTLRASMKDDQKKIFDDHLWSYSYRNIDTMSENELASISSLSPDRKWVKYSIGRLERDRDKRGENFDILGTAFKNTKSPVNRFWIMEEAADASHLQFEKDKTAESLRNFFSLGFNDNSDEVRAAALLGAFKLYDRTWPAEEQIGKIITSEPDKDRKLKVIKSFDQWMLNVWHEALNDKNTKDKALPKLIDLAMRTNDEDIAKLAIQFLPKVEKSEKNNFSNLVYISNQNKFAKCRHEALYKIRITGIEENLDVFLKALDDKSPENRYFAFQSLLNEYSYEKTSKIMPKLKAAAGREPDAKTKEKMQNDLKPYNKK